MTSGQGCSLMQIKRRIMLAYRVYMSIMCGEVVSMRWRNMFYMTGQPGWMRFGYSPGWGGMPPGAQYLAQTGQVPAFQAWMGSQAPVPPWWGAAPAPWATQEASREDEMAWLTAQAESLEAQLGEIRRRVDELSPEEG